MEDRAVLLEMEDSIETWVGSGAEAGGGGRVSCFSSEARDDGVVACVRVVLEVAERGDEAEVDVVE